MAMRAIGRNPPTPHACPAPAPTAVLGPAWAHCPSGGGGGRPGGAESSKVTPLGDGPFLQVQKSSPFLPDSLGTSSRMPPWVFLEGSQAL